MPAELRFSTAALLLAVAPFIALELHWRFHMTRRSRALFRKWDRMIDGAYFSRSPDPVEEYLAERIRQASE